MATHAEQILRLATERGMIRSRDIQALGIARAQLARLHSRGVLRRVSRGIYVLADSAPTGNSDLAEVCLHIPRATICLLSALSFHGIGTQLPFEVWIAISNKARRPRLEFPPLHVVRYSEAALNTGVEEYITADGMVRVYSVAKTVVDCFRYRNKVGLDVALEALREARRQHKATTDELWHYARLLRVASVMRPYLEAVI